MKVYTMKELRELKGMTQAEVANVTGFSKDYISMIERGKRNASDNAKEKFAKLYNVSIPEIFLALNRTKSSTKKRCNLK